MENEKETTQQQVQPVGLQIRQEAVLALIGQLTIEKAAISEQLASSQTMTQLLAKKADQLAAEVQRLQAEIEKLKKLSNIATDSIGE